MRRQSLDFTQVTYNLLDREVEQRILPLAQDRGIAVIVNRPFRQGDLIRQVQRHPLPTRAGELGAANWAQFLLKFIVSHPGVTCAIPATSQVAHVKQNMGAAVGALAGPAGAVAGGAIGTVVGAIAGGVMDREDTRADARDRELDDAIGVTRGTLGTPEETKRPSTEVLAEDTGPPREVQHGAEAASVG